MTTPAEMALQNLFERDEVSAGLHNQKVGARRMRKTLRNGKQSANGDIVVQMMTIRDQVKLYHWQTRSFARHKATDDLVAKLDLNIDTFVETYMGKYGRPRVSRPIKLTNFTESAARVFVARQRLFLSTVLPRNLSPHDTDLLNIRDTILGDLNQVLYLFTLD